MRIKIILSIAFFILMFLYFRKDIIPISEEMLLPDQNPELVTYLQGDWSVTQDNKSIIQIKRDSIIKIYNDTIRSVNTLYYVFSGAASKYFTKESSFVFSSVGEHSLTTYDFKLKEVNNNLPAIEWDTLVYVSKSRLDMISRGNIISFSRVK
jgi:hypothetical protein